MAPNLAFVALQLGDYRRAVMRATYALTAVPTPHKDRAKTFYRRGIAFAALYEFCLAAADFSDALELMPGDTTVKEQLKRLRKPLTEEFPQSTDPIERARGWVLEERREELERKEATCNKMNADANAADPLVFDLRQLGLL